ncbi:MAG: hypothetical protein J0H44_18700 [Alphaproteobacteria bacterium]|nr:hypothetical protein [Alphaproteobacteria bacterium]
MSAPGPNDGGQRASRTIKLVLMGVAGAALLFSCTPGIGTALGGWPGFWFWGNPFYRGTTISSPSSSASTTTHGTTPSGTTSGQTTSQRGGFGGSAATHGSTAS